MKSIALGADVPRERLDRFISRHCPDLSRSYIQRLIQEGYITLNGSPAKPSQKLKPGQRILVRIPPPRTLALEPEPMELKVLYEDSDILVIDKPAGMVTHPSPGHPEHTLVNAILARCPDLAGVAGTLRPGIVHRLDKGTSGLLVVAKNDRAQRSLMAQIKERKVDKRYIALVKRRVEPATGTIEAPIGRHPVHRKKMAVVPTKSGRAAATRYRVLHYLSFPLTLRQVQGLATPVGAQGERGSSKPQAETYTLLEVHPLTGRTHQIRVHLSSTGHPLVGDPTYGGKADLLQRPFLHAYRLGFRLPSTGEYREFMAPLPEDLREVLKQLGYEWREQAGSSEPMAR